MGDGGIIAQITDLGTGKIVAVTNGSWQLMVIHRAPLNPECEKAADPNTACRFESTDAPPGWAGADFDASSGFPPLSGRRPPCALRTATTRSNGTNPPD